MAYAATFGGVCTLVGTSTNLVVNGLLIESTGSGMKMFDLTWVGLPAALAAVAFLVLAGGCASTESKKPRCTIPGLYLVEIERAEERLAAVSPRQRLQSRDRLVFVGVVESVVDLQKLRGLTRAADAPPFSSIVLPPIGNCSRSSCRIVAR